MDKWKTVVESELKILDYLPEYDPNNASEAIIDNLSNTELEKLKSELKVLNTQYLSQKSINSDLESQLSQASNKLHDFENPPTVLEFAANPFQEHKAKKIERLKNLESDKVKLLAKVKNLEFKLTQQTDKVQNLEKEKEELTNTLNETKINQTDTTLKLDTTDLTLQGDAIQKCIEYEKKLKEEVELRKKLVSQHKTVFIDRLNEYRQLSEKLFGWKVKRIRQNFHIFSCYAENDTDYTIF